MTHWLELPAGTAFVEFSELSHRLALTLHPAAPDDRRYDLRYGVAEMNLKQELHKAVDAGRLRVLDPLTHGPHSFPVGAALQSAVVKLSELRAFLVDRGIGVRVLPAEPAPAVMPAPEPTAKAEAALPPVATSTKETLVGLAGNPMQRRSMLLELFREAGGKRPKEGAKGATRGALASVVKQSGIHKDTLGPMLDKAIEEKRSADAFAQLTAKR